MVEFFRTRMGHRFFESTMPRIAEELARLADNVAALNKTIGTWLNARQSAGPRPRLRVLLVDDHEHVLQALERLLKAQEHEVLLAATPEAALELIDLHELDAVITDHDMPGEHDGIWLLEQVRAKQPDARRVLTSGREPPDLERHQSSGLIHGFLTKPASAAELLALLRTEQP